MWSKLEILYHIVKAGSLIKAAEVLKTDQPTLTRKLATLEKKFGFKLINRSTSKKPLTLTEQGKVAFEAAQKTFMTIQMMETSLFEKQGMKGKIRVNTNHFIGYLMLNPLMIDFANQYPESNLELLCDDSLIDIYKNEVDFLIRPYIDEDPTLVQEPLFTLETGLYATQDYLDTFGTPQTVADLDHHRLIPFIRPDQNPYCDTDWILKVGREGKNMREPFYRVNSVASFWEAAEKGMGIFTSYEPMLKHKKTNFVRVLEDLKGPVHKHYLIYPKKLEDVERIQKFKTFLQENI